MSALRSSCVFFTLAAALSPAQALEYGPILAEKSSLTFVSKQMGVPVDGRFREFTATLAFDPAQPTQASARMEVDLASIDAGSQEASAEVAGKSWLNIKAFPTANFISTTVKPLGGERFEIAGKLSIKGRTENLVAPATFRQEGPNGVFDGSFILKRLDFALGDGMWSDLSAVANEVQIRFHLVAAPRK